MKSLSDFMLVLILLILFIFGVLCWGVTIYNADKSLSNTEPSFCERNGGQAIYTNDGKVFGCISKMKMHAR